MFAASCYDWFVGLVGYDVVGVNSVVIVVCTWRYVFGLFCVARFAGFGYCIWLFWLGGVVVICYSCWLCLLLEFCCLFVLV